MSSKEKPSSEKRSLIRQKLKQELSKQSSVDSSLLSEEILDEIVQQASQELFKDVRVGRDLIIRGDIIQKVIQIQSRNIQIESGNYIEYLRGNYIETQNIFFNSKQPDGQNIPCNIKKKGSANFVGREKKLEELHQLLQKNEQVSISAIAGMGGIGKSELALQYALAYQNEYPGSLCWFSVRGENIGTQIIEYAGSYLDIYAPDEVKSDLAKVQYCWRNWSSEKSLIVLDDVPDYGKYYQENVDPYLPPVTNQIKVLMTSRERPVGIPRLDLDVLTKEAALKLLTALAGAERIVCDIQSQKDYPSELCEWLGYLPLGLELVGRYLELDLSLSINTILQRLKDKKLEAEALLTPEQTNMIAQLGVAAAFELSWQELNSQAQRLGCYLSLFTPEPFEWTWIEKSLVKTSQFWWKKISFNALTRLFNRQSLETKLKEETETEVSRELNKNKRDLLKRNLLRIIPDAQLPNKYLYQLHALIQQYFRAKLGELEEAKELKQKFCRQMIGIARSIPKTPTQEDIKAVALAIPHLMIVAKDLINYVDDENLIWSCEVLGRFYGGQGAYERAEEWYERSLTICRRKLGEEHPDVATSMNDLATLYYKQGRYSEAEPLYVEALKKRREVLGEEHPDVATSMNDLAALYRRQGRYSEAEPLYVEALEKRREVLGEEHPDVATSMNDLAALYYKQGRYSEAEPLYVEALEMSRRILGEEHPDVAQSMNNLAILYNSQGRYSEAKLLLIGALEMRKRLLGQEHPDVATSINNLALLYSSQGRYEEAEPLYLEALEMRKRLLGQEHPSIATSINNLALLYSSQGRYDSAEPLYKEALEMWKKLLGEEHPDVATSINNLAELYESQGRYSEAEPLYVEALEMSKKLLGEEHPSVAGSLNNLAALYDAQGRYERAEPLYIEALAMSKKLLGEEHPSVATSLNNLAGLYNNQGRYEDAEPLFLQALEMRKKLLGQEHPDVAMSIYWMAFLYHKQGRYSEAEPLYIQALAIAERALGKDHPNTKQIRENYQRLLEEKK